MWVLITRYDKDILLFGGGGGYFRGPLFSETPM